jgi:predicted DNA-binding protein
MRSRTDTYAFRISNEEGEIIRAVADRLGRTEPDMIRTVIKAVAKELGVLSPQQDGKQADRQEVSSTAT